MKYLGFMMLLLPLTSWALPLCEVDGISDSPQQIECSITRDQGLEKVNLICQDGVYYFKWQDKKIEVMIAYHEEVETGSSPLVFESDGLRLRTTANHNQNSAEFRVGPSLGNGLCIAK